MRKQVYRAVVTALVVGVLGGAGTESKAQYNRETPIVRAVKKTRQGIITIKVKKQGSWSGKDIVGTGVIVDERGYAITNCHVVSGAGTLSVSLCDGTRVAAEVYTEIPGHDLAILKLASGRKYHALHFAPGSDLMVGETVIAVGHPFGYTNTVSTGIISALDREITMPAGATLTHLIQTNASINPGNSGGPLLNINGELIGINVAIRDGAQGIAFALNSDTVQDVLSRKLSASRLAHLRHGLVCKAVVEEGPQSRQKVVVDQVSVASPAARAGLRPGDVIVRVAHREVSNRFDLERALWGCKAGDQIETAVVRDGKEVRVGLTLSRDAEERDTRTARND